MTDWAALEARNAPLNAFVDFDREAIGGTGPLAGLGIGIKANIAVKGLPWTAGLAFRRGIIADEDATAVQRLRAAGACILGTLNLDEGALGAATDNPWFGRTINPHRAGYTAGGSSGGSAAAVAAGLCDAALGSDTMGSVRIPAAYCGIYGLKPTNGAVSDDGVMRVDAALDCIGPLARDLNMLERVWHVIADAPAIRLHTLSRVFVLDSLGGVAADPSVVAGYEGALAGLGAPRLGLRLTHSLNDIRRAGFIQIGQSLAVELGSDRAAHADEISPSLHYLLDYCARGTPEPDLLAETRAALRRALGDDGLLILPTAPQAAFAQGARVPANQADFTCLANIAGLPAIALPSGRDETGLPVSIQLIGPPHSELALIACARQIDAALQGYFPPPDYHEE